MDNSIVEENGNSSAASGSNDVVDVVAQQAAAAGGGGGGVGGGGGGGNPQQQQQQNPQSTTAGGPTGATNNAQGGGASSVLTTTANCNIQYPIQALAQHGLQVQSVIQANPSGVIQTAAGTQQQQQQQALAAATAMQKVVYVAKPPNSTVIHTTPGNAVQVRNKIPPTFPCKIKPEPNTQHPEDSDESLSDDDSQHHRSELTRRPSYNKIFTEISGPDMSGKSGGRSLHQTHTHSNTSLSLLKPLYRLTIQRIAKLIAPHRSFHDALAPGDRSTTPSTSISLENRSVHQTPFIFQCL